MMKEIYLGPVMKKICEEIDRRAGVEIKKYNLTLSQARVILFLADNGGKTVTQKELEDFLQVSHPTTVTIIRSMESKQMVRTYFDESDRRMKIVELIWGNQSIYSELKQNALNIEAQLLDGFSQDEVNDFYSYLIRAYQNIWNNH